MFPAFVSKYCRSENLLNRAVKPSPKGLGYNALHFVL